MRRRFVAAVFVGAVATAVPAHAAPDSPPTYRIPVTKPDRQGATLTIACASLEADALN